MSKQINIGGRLHSTEQGNVITGANEVLDDTKGKKQNVINADVDAELLRLDQSKQNNLTFDNTPTENSNNPVKSSGVYAADKALSDAIDAILILIPSAATALNQLADKNFVNSSIATDTATFRGTSETGLSEAQFLEWANGLTHDMNDYVFWQTIDEAGNTLFKRYKWNGTQWLYEYTLNNSSFTADQWAAITSGITTALVEKLVGLPTNTALQQALNSKQDALTFDNVPTENSINPVKSGGVYSAIKAEEDARLNLSQTVNGISGDVSQIEDVIPAGATELNQLVANASMEAYVASIIQNITSSFTLATADGHINLTLTQTNGQVSTLTLTSSDIASAQDVANLQQLYNNLQQSKPEPVTALPETGQQQGVIYRLAGTTSYSDYMWNGSTWVLMATYNNAVDPRPKKASQNLVTSGGVFDNMGALDISELNATENPHTLATYADLSAALAAITSNDYKKGGMSIKFVQTDDKKYIQARCMAQNFTTDVTKWQGIDTTPDPYSKNLVESGGVNDRLHYIERGNLPDTYNYYIGYTIDSNGNIVSGNGYVVTDKIPVVNGHSITVTGKGSCRINLLDNNGEYFNYYSYGDARQITLNFDNIGYIQFNAEADFSELKVYDNTTSTTIYKNTINAGVDFKSKILQNESDIAQENNKLVSLADYGVNKLRNDSSVIEISVNEEKYYDANYIVKAGRTYYISNYTGRFTALKVVDYSGTIVETINKNVVAEDSTHITFSHEGHLHLNCIPSSGNLKCAIVSGEDINDIAKYNNMLSDVLFSYTDCGDFEYGYYALQNMNSLPLTPSSESQSSKYIVREVRKSDCLFIKASCISSVALGYALTDTERNIYEKDVLFAPFGTWLIAKKDGFICINSVLDGAPTPSLTIFTPKMNIATLSNSMIIKKKVYIGNDGESNVELFDNLNIPVNTRISLLIEGDFEWTRLAVYANNDWNDAPDRIDNIVNGTIYHRAVNNIITNYRVYKITGSEVGYVTATLVIGDNTQFAYQGEKISIIPKVNWEMLAHSTNRSKMQDGDCYKNIYFQFHDLAQSEFFHGVEVFDLEKDGALIQSIELPVETDFHCNSVSFGPNKYADSDIFPLLYVCGFWGSPDIVVYRIGGTYGSYTLTEVQRIHLIGERWVNAFVDSRGFIYTQKPHVENVTDTITKYELPLVSEGDVTLSTPIESFDIDVTDPFGYGTTNGEQGGIIHNGKLFLCFGFDNNRNRISVIDLINKNICSNIGTLTSMGLDAEVEGCFIYKDKLGVSFNGSGQIIALSFE